MTSKRKTSTKRKRTRNDLAMAYRIDALPRRIRKVDFYRTLLDFLDGEIDALPVGWKITWRWQNSKKQNWREGEFTEVVANSDKSRGGFITLMRRRLQRDLDKLSPAKRTPGKRKKRTRKAAKKRKRSRKMSKVRKAKSRGGKTRKRHNRA